MKKVLFVATVAKHHIVHFHIPYLKWFKEKGFETHVCAKNDFSENEDWVIPYCDKYFDLKFERNPISLGNFNVYKELKKILEQNEYDIIHCHTPVASVLLRLAARNVRKKGTVVIYTAHGFHFYKGASLTNWILYYPIEKFLSKYTDVLLTINNEDYERALKGNFNCKEIKIVNGVGVNFSKFFPVNKNEKLELREKYNLKNEFVALYVAEMNYGKHQDLIINATKDIINNISNFKLLLVGTGDMIENYKKQAIELNVDKHIDFLGYRKDVDYLMKISDIYISCSRREGLPVNVMEAMATGLPLIVTDCRGNRDLVCDKENGYIIEIDDCKKLVKNILYLFNNQSICEMMRKNNIEKIKKFELDKIIDDMGQIYSRYL